MRSCLLLVVVLAVAAFAVPAALADQPTFTPVENLDFVDSSSCDFPVDIHVDQSHETMRTFSNGDFSITGTLKVTLSNETDPSKSITINVSGPIFFFVDRSGDPVVRFTGPAFGTSFSFPITLSYSHGQILFDLATGSFKQVGTTRDLCRVLR